MKIWLDYDYEGGWSVYPEPFWSSHTPDNSYDIPDEKWVAYQKWKTEEDEWWNYFNDLEKERKKALMTAKVKQQKEMLKDGFTF